LLVFSGFCYSSLKRQIYSKAAGWGTTGGFAGSLQILLQEMTTNLRNLIGNIVAEGRALSGTSTEFALSTEDMIGGAE